MRRSRISQGKSLFATKPLANHHTQKGALANSQVILQHAHLIPIGPPLCLAAAWHVHVAAKYSCCHITRMWHQHVHVHMAVQCSCCCLMCMWLLSVQAHIWLHHCNTLLHYEHLAAARACACGTGMFLLLHHVQLAAACACAHRCGVFVVLHILQLAAPCACPRWCGMYMPSNLRMLICLHYLHVHGMPYVHVPVIAACACGCGMCMPLCSFSSTPPTTRTWQSFDTTQMDKCTWQTRTLAI